MILAGDIGGTKTILGLFSRDGKKLQTLAEQKFPSQGYRSLEAMIRDFIDAHQHLVARNPIKNCAVGIAGPVVNGRSHLVNLKWRADATRLARSLDLPRAWVLNDLEATGWGVRELPSRKLHNLTPGVRPRAGNAALIAAGTGLGTATMFWNGTRHVPSAGEGGHQNFAPRTLDEIDLLRFMMRRYKRVSIERIVAGPGLGAIYEFLVESGRCKKTARMQRVLDEEQDDNAAVSRMGLAGKDAGARRALEMFVSLYGAVAGDLALVTRALGGIYVGGGIAPKILDAIDGGAFVEAFRDKGRLRSFVETIPVKVILEPRTALLGAAARAAAGDV
ncbi:hypothetical protein ABI59_16340 [Acidobacteria bacterium Mor1]|nr:hypothetical protein ABI59_16340 [Acidobacteria bacterium Mor1]